MPFGKRPAHSLRGVALTLAFPERKVLLVYYVLVLCLCVLGQFFNTLVQQGAFLLVFAEHFENSWELFLSLKHSGKVKAKSDSE